MKRRKLGRTDLHVSELNLEAHKFGWLADETESFALLDAYYTCGGNFIQTMGLAPRSLTMDHTESASEDIVGRWREARGVSRDGLVLASRFNFFRPPHGGSIAFANHIREACERSLRRLRTKHFDLLICEWDDDLHPIGDVLEAVDQLFRAGFVRYVVAGGFPPWRVVDSLHRSASRNHARFEALQAEYPLINRSGLEPEALAMCREHRLGFLATLPVAGGFFTRRHVARPEFNHDWRNERFGSQAENEFLKVLAEVAERRRATPAEVALAWVLRNPQVATAAMSAANPRELRKLIRAADMVLSPEETGALASVTTPRASPTELHHA
jgi:aryl-alcohol dehydrogenase-like predicted oxidoreductase